MADAQFTPEWDKALLTNDVGRIVALVRQAHGVFPQDKQGATPLHLAPGFDAIDGRGEAAAMTVAIIAGGASVHSVTQAGFTPLHMAARHDCLGCVRALLRAGAKVNARSVKGFTPLHHSHPAVRALLLAAGGDANAVDDLGRPPLHTVQVPGTELLGVGLNAVDAMGFTALHWAAFEGRGAAVAWLLAQGAKTHLRSIAPYVYRDGILADEWATSITYAAGQRAFDLAKARHDSSKWSTGSHRQVFELLDKATPRQSFFNR